MNESDLKQQLDNVDKTPVDPAARQRAIASAMAEFKAVQQEKAAHNAAHNPAKNSQQKKTEKNSQGFFQWLRLTFNSANSDSTEDRKMTQLFQQKWFLGGLATASIAFFGVMITYNNLDVKAPGSELNPAPPPALTRQPQTGNTDVARDQAQAEVVMHDIHEQIAETYSAEQEAAPKLRQSHAPLAKRELSRAMAPQGFAAKPAPAPAMDTDALPNPSWQDEGRDRFESFETNPLKLTSEEPVSTFSIDVDTASYSFIRRQLNNGVLPQKDAVRLEEMVNYFDYDYPLPESKAEPFSRSITVIDAPWNKEHKLMHIGIKGYEIKEQPASNLVFLLDVSGSMNSPDKLPLVKQSMNLLLSQLRADDTVAIAVYAGASGTVLEPTQVKEKQKILNAINNLRAGGGTAGAEGIKLAYQLAESSFRKDAVNRIILATDGDFNVGITSTEELKGFVERKREKGIYLSVLGFGAGNYHDQLMQSLAQNGNGTAAYIDTLSEAQKVLVTEATSSLFPIANDVKIQVEFNPSTVAEYRLLGYETRKLNREDFNNDKVDAGEIGAGHTVTAIYEITPTTSKAKLIDESRYSQKPKSDGLGSEYGFVKIRYKLPQQKESKLLQTPVPAENTPVSANTRLLLREANFASAVAGFAQLLKDGKYTGNWTYDDAIALAQANKGDDLFGYRTEFIQLIRKAQMAQQL